jgi:hypothetical protein
MNHHSRLDAGGRDLSIDRPPMARPGFPGRPWNRVAGDQQHCGEREAIEINPDEFVTSIR